MRVVIPGGTGQVGWVLRRALVERGDEVAVLSRRPSQLEQGVRHVVWDGRTLGAWARELDGADAVVNLAGRTVSCRYTDTNLRQMMDSRVDSTRVVGQAIAQAERPPRVWVQMSTATIYADSRSRPDDRPHDEANGILGGEEPDVPLYWEYSVRIARRWEAAQAEADLPGTRRVALRAAMVMTPDRGGVFDYLSWMARLGLGGPVADGGQYVSWIHGEDFVRAVQFLLAREDLDGAFIVAAPEPVQQRDLMRALRRAWGGRPGLPATRLMAELGAFVLRTDTELLLKSRRVVPGRLLDAGFAFAHPNWEAAAADLVHQARMLRAGSGGLPSAAGRNHGRPGPLSPRPQSHEAPGPLLLYDGDCGFCEKAAGLAPRFRLGVSVRAMQGVDLARLGVEPQRAERELPFVGADGEVVYGHQAVAAALLTGNVALRLVGRALGSSLAARPMAAVYRWTARNRGSLPGSTRICATAVRPPSDEEQSSL